MNYIYFDSTENEWKPATLEELAMMNAPSLPVCELDENGNARQQTTYEQLKAEVNNVKCKALRKYTKQHDRDCTYFLIRVCCALHIAVLLSKFNWIENIIGVFLLSLIVLGVAHLKTFFETK